MSEANVASVNLVSLYIKTFNTREYKYSERSERSERSSVIYNHDINTRVLNVATKRVLNALSMVISMVVYAKTLFRWWNADEMSAKTRKTPLVTQNTPPSTHWSTDFQTVSVIIMALACATSPNSSKFPNRSKVVSPVFILLKILPAVNYDARNYWCCQTNWLWFGWFLNKTPLEFGCFVAKCCCWWRW